MKNPRQKDDNKPIMTRCSLMSTPHSHFIVVYPVRCPGHPSYSGQVVIKVNKLMDNPRHSNITWHYMSLLMPLWGCSCSQFLLCNNTSRSGENIWHHATVCWTSFSHGNIKENIKLAHYWDGKLPVTSDSPYKGSVMRKGFACHDFTMAVVDRNGLAEG